ncbi:MAG: acylphosphatase [Candidatus Melainabacteria bacterium HGW-Melainabacteria-1]|nr:MAG: acylphosphatase [Candidatus Melainabacteria bacterium HGW-Melainabacteria-1]
MSVNEAHIRVHLWIRGRVQGVFFRQSTWQRAQAIGGLRGWVRNLPDGRVEVLAQGTAPAVEALVTFCRQGPPQARVDQLERQDESPRADLAPFDMIA